MSTTADAQAAPGTQHSRSPSIETTVEARCERQLVVYLGRTDLTIEAAGGFPGSAYVPS